MRQYLDDAFAVPAGTAGTYTLECRGMVCKWGSAQRVDETRVQDYRVDGLIRSREFGRHGNYFALSDDVDRRVTPLMTSLTVAFHRSSAFQTCTASLPAENGVVTFTLTFEPADRRLVAAARTSTMSVQDEPSDVCRRALQSVADATPIPADIVSIPAWEFSFSIYATGDSPYQP